MYLYSLYKRGLLTFWYWYVRKLNTLWPSITVAGRRIKVRPTVYKPIENEYVCLDHCNPGERVLDLGCGSGVCTVLCAEKVREVVAVDISPAALEVTAENCRDHGLENVKIFESDMFENVEGRFDLIIANAPYISTDFEDPGEQFATSVRYLPILFSEVHNYLAPGGRLAVQFPIWFRRKMERLADSHGLTIVSVKRLPPKSLKLMLISLVYLQVGFRSATFLMVPKAAADSANGDAAQPQTQTSRAA